MFMGINNERVKKGTKTKLIRLKEKRKKKKSSTKKAERKLMVLCNGIFFSYIQLVPSTIYSHFIISNQKTFLSM